VKRPKKTGITMMSKDLEPDGASAKFAADASSSRVPSRRPKERDG
jgi:hypothetical protein